jgi:hypothetical protein
LGAVAAFVLACALWWVYYVFVASAMRHSLATSPVLGQVRCHVGRVCCVVVPLLVDKVLLDLGGQVEGFVDVVVEGGAALGVEVQAEAGDVGLCWLWSVILR